MSTGHPPRDDRCRLDADASLERARSLHDAAREESGAAAVELYHRAARTLRVGIGPDDGTRTRWSGVDEGIALRATTRQGNELAFTASTGSAMPSLGWVLRQARGVEATVSRRRPWAHSTAGPQFDREADTGLPPVEEVTEWLLGARAALQAEGPEPSRPLESWVEVAHTVESWVADGGLEASRVRTRGWALLRTSGGGSADRGSKPVLVARRRWEELPASAWRSALEDRRLPGGAPEPPPTRAAPVLFNPECSALLVRALVWSLHSGGREGGAPVGPAWRVTDDPRGQGALFGGRFDDAGFPTRRKRLADGQRANGVLEGPGHYRRPSFRDRPVSLPSHLVVASGKASPPDRCVLATALGLHTVGADRWVLRIEGAMLRGGRPGPVLRPSFVAVSPGDLVQRCVASVGPARPSHVGVETPALVFDNLSLQPCGAVV